jgi:hemoglobin
MIARALIASLFLAGAGFLSVQADDAPIDRVELDKRLARIANESIILGVTLYEEKNYEGCSRLYEGTLVALEPLLDHHPKLAEMVGERLEKSRDPKMTSWEAAQELRKALEAVQAETAKALKPKTAWDRLRGETGVRAMVKDFLIAAIADPKVNASRGGTLKLDAKTVAKLEQHLVEWISSQMEGPLKYTGPEIRKGFAGLDVTEAEFDAAVAQLEATLKHYNVSTEDAKKLITAINRQKTQIVKP